MATTSGPPESPLASSLGLVKSISKIPYPTENRLESHLSRFIATPSMDSTILIIGAGTFGVSTAWHLSQNHADPSKVTIIDRQASPPSLPAAADINRILTADYSSSLYSNLAKEALEFWAEDPDLEWYFHKVGRLVLTEHESEGSRRCIETQDVKLSEISGRWGALDDTDIKPFQRAYLDSEAGWVDSATATWQFLETAVRRRVKKEVGDVSELIVDKGSRIIKGVRTADGRTFLAENVVLATGAWTSALLSPIENALDLAEEDLIEQQARATAIVSAAFPVSDKALKEFTACKLPCVIYGTEGEVVPASRDNRMLRYNNLSLGIVNTVTTSSRRQISVPPAQRSQNDVPELIRIDMESRLTHRLMPRFAKRKPKWRMCWDNHTPTEDLLLCEHPQVKSLFIITGGSFNGYKFMPNIGKYMINILRRQSNGVEMDRAWGWKSKEELHAAGSKFRQRRELIDLDIGSMSKL